MVKCAECGFLAVRSRSDWTLVEAVSEYRETGKIPGGLWNLVYASPICFAMARDLLGEAKLTSKGVITESEFQKVSGSEAFLADFREVLNCERECNNFTKWQQGSTPKEHKEMIDRRWERKWFIITGVIFVVLAGLFTLLGAYIADLN